jgi:hypothetical protein
MQAKIQKLIASMTNRMSKFCKPPSKVYVKSIWPLAACSLHDCAKYLTLTR